jgi:uncharacterized protein
MSSSLSPPNLSGASVAWLEWSPIAFERAANQGRPVLLSITASWCHGCAVMDRVAYAEPRVTAIIERSFVPVRVDADRRPDINDRYNLDGWPTTALLTPSGEMLTGTTYLPADGLLAMLAEVAEAYTTRRSALDQRAADQAQARRARLRTKVAGIEPDLAAPAWIARRVVEECDPEHGGFGADGKFLHVPALTVALSEFERTGDPALGRAIALTLDGMAGGQIRDEIDGGFFRYAAGADWSRPHTEKMLDDQVGIAVLYLEAARLLGHARWRDIGRDVVTYVRTTLADEADARFFASQAAHDAYYQVRSASLRRTLDAPVVDRTLFVDHTARAAAAWIRAGAMTGAVSLTEAAARALDRIVTLTYQPGQGVAHWFDGHASARGLLTDQVHTAWALIALHEATANPTWSMAAEELMRTALRTMWDSTSGAFLDRAPEPADVGLVADPVVPLATNALAAGVLSRLSRLTGDLVFQEHALEILRALAPTYRQQGLFGAPYALAVTETLGK